MFPILAATTVALLLTPSFVFVAVALIEGLGPGETFAALAEQFTSDRINLAVISLLGAAPVLLILFSLWIRRLLRKTWDGSDTYALGGALPVIAVALFINLEYWPTYLPERQFLGFPHGLEFIIGPGLFAPVAMLIGFCVAWFIRRRA